MRGYKLSDKLHSTFLKFKNVYLFVFALTTIVAGLNVHTNVFSRGLVASVETRINVSYDNKQKTFIATQNTVEGALKQAGVSLSDLDITEPSRESLLLGGESDIRVIRALPILISDNNQERLAYSAYTDSLEILRQLEVTIYPEDVVTSELIVDPVFENAVGQKVIIQRAPVFTVYVDGGEKIVRSWGKTIAEVLEGKIALGQRDIVEPAKGDASTDIREITITRVNVAEIEEVLTIPYQTTEKNDYALYKGQTKITQEGSNGKKKQNVRITYHNGEEIGRVVLNSEIVSQPVNKMVLIGVKPYNAGTWWDTLVAAGTRYGIDPLDLYNVMDCESHGNPYSIGYSSGQPKYYGLFQYNLGLWSSASAAAGYGGSSWADGVAQIYSTAKYASINGWSAWGCKP